MIDGFAKEYLHSDLSDVRETMLWKLEGLSEYDVRRPLTYTGTNLLGLIKHLSISEAWYFGDVFGRPFPGNGGGGTIPPATATSCGLLRMSHGPRSSTATGERGSTRTRRSPPSTSTHPAMCPGGHART